MKKDEVSQDQYLKILDKILPVLMKNGLKATTMDSLASGLQMSKRTLYEIFGSKDEMFREVHKYFQNKMSTKLKEIFDTSDNVMEAIIQSFLYNRDVMSLVNVEFIRDIEQYVHNENSSECSRQPHYQNLYEVLKQGVDGGFFREDVNLKVQCRMFSIQMESLKRMEELFPDDISLLEVFDSIIVGFLRGISSSKGLAELEKFMPSLTQNINLVKLP